MWAFRAGHGVAEGKECEGAFQRYAFGLDGDFVIIIFIFFFGGGLRSSAGGSSLSGGSG